MNREQILEAIKELAKSQGSYGRLYEELMLLDREDQAAYEATMQEWEGEGFETPFDLILYLEEGKHCKKKYWKIPVCWEMYGTVEVEADTIEEAIEKFKKIEYEGEGFALPYDGSYVDGSFELSDDDPENLKGLIALMNKENLEKEVK